MFIPASFAIEILIKPHDAHKTDDLLGYPEVIQTVPVRREPKVLEFVS